MAQKLRRALYYTNHSVDPVLALKYYRQAILMADEMGMDPFSDEILGVKIQLGFMFEKTNNWEMAVKVHEMLRTDCLRWLEEFGEKEGNEAKRTRILGKVVQISSKLGELYSSDYVQRQEDAEAALIFAIETALRERIRREREGVKPDEGEWMSNEQLGAAMEGRKQTTLRRPRRSLT